MRNFLSPLTKKHRISLSLCLLFFASHISLSAENFRVKTLIPLPLTGLEEKITVSSSINDALFITLPNDLTYVSGIELNLKIPEEIATWRDSVAYMLYENMEPLPSEKSKNYSGDRVHLDTLPGKLSLTIHIPISPDFSIKDSPYSVKIQAPKDFQKGIFLRFMMVMKGVPESLENAILEITAKPVLKNLGALSLTTSPASTDEKKYSVFIDDLPVQDYETKMLPTGEHHLSVVSDSYRNELRTFRIEQAKTTTLAVQLRGIEPLLKILCPKNTQVFLDGEPTNASGEAFLISQGEHAVKFILGDYEIVKTISAINGRTYSVNLNVDATISEEE
ncbi:MAG: hypothetical protein IJ257_02010 [Treponema sp.]|nr:hypothetical protein [Treponema sp.]